MRKLISNKTASGFGTLLVFFPFIVSMILTGLSYSLEGDTSGVNSMGMLYTPNNYENMTLVQRASWLNTTHGGNFTAEWRWRLALTFPDFLGQWYYIWPDGFELEADQYQKFLNGQASDPDYVQVSIAIMTVNPPMLEDIGVFGILIRIILVVSVCIGLAEIIWIG